MPSRSSSFTRLASEKRGGGSVKCWLGVIALHGTFSPTSTTGSACSSSSALCRPLRAPRDRARGSPGTSRSCPWRGTDSCGGRCPAASSAGMSKSTVVVSNTAGAICDAMKRCQIELIELELVGAQILLDVRPDGASDPWDASLRARPACSSPCRRRRAAASSQTNSSPNSVRR